MMKKFEQFIFESYNCEKFYIKNRLAFLINESQESESQKAAIALVMNEFGWDKEKANKFIRNDLRNTFPPLKDKKIAKFTLGVTRMYVSGEIDEANVISELNATLKLLSAHLNEYDRNLNGLSAIDIISKFKKSRKENVEREKREISKIKFGVSEYDIVKIDSFNDTKKYYKYTNPNSRWCLTHMEDMYDQYTCDGFNQLYFCLKHGYEDVKPIVGENTPLDDYGLSMLSIIVNGDGELAYSTCRWNHDNGGSDNVMDAILISKVVNVDFYETFKPNNKWGDILNNAKSRLENGERPEKVFDKYIRCNNGNIIVAFIIKNNPDYEYDEDDYGYDEDEAYIYRYNIIKDGKYLLDVWVDYIDNYHGDYAKVKLNGDYNAIDKDGNFLLKKWVSNVKDFHTLSLAQGLILIEGNYNKGYNYIDTDGNIIFNEWLEDVNGYYDDYARVKLNDKWNIFDTNNRKIISDIWFDWVGRFHNGYADVQLDSKKNYIDTNGDLLLKKWADETHYGGNGYTSIKIDNKWNYISINKNFGKFLLDEWYDEVYEFTNGFAKIKSNDKWNYINSDGDIIFDEWFDEVYDYYEGYTAVKINNKWNFINSDMKIISLSDVFKGVYTFVKNEVAIIKLDFKKYNCINTYGKLITDEWFDEITDNFDDKFVKVKMKNKYNLINTQKNGKIVFDEWFDEIYEFKNGFAQVKLNDRWNYINSDGEIISGVWFDSVGGYRSSSSFKDGFVEVRLNSKYNFIDTNGNLTIDDWVITDVGEFEDGFAKVEIRRGYKDVVYNYINSDRKLTIDKWVDAIYRFRDGFAQVKLKDKYNLINTDRTLVFDEWFDDIYASLDSYSNENGYVLIKLNKKYNFINLNDGKYLSDEWFESSQEAHDYKDKIYKNK